MLRVLHFLRQARVRLIRRARYAFTVFYFRGGSGDSAEPMVFFINSLLRYVYLVYGFRRRVNYIGAERGLANAHSFLIDELDKQTALLDCHSCIFFCHLATFVSDNFLI